MNGFGVAQALAYQVHVPLRGSYPAGGFFLKSVQDIQDALETHRVDGSIGVAVKVVANFQNPAQTLQGLGIVRMLPDLRFEKGLPDPAADGRRNPCKSFRLEPTKTAGLIVRSRSFTAL